MADVVSPGPTTGNVRSQLTHHPRVMTATKAESSAYDVDVANRLGRWLSIKEIADDLGISMSTAYN